MSIALLTLWFFQGLLMLVDEFYFHYERGLPKWERYGHPLDTFFFFIVFLFSATAKFDSNNIPIFIGLSFFSCLFITKDEWVHSQQCGPGEQWLHSILFIIHPLSLYVCYFFWHEGQQHLIQLQALLIFVFMLYQIFYWNIFDRLFKTRAKINNNFYNDLAAKDWLHKKDHPIALLRSEQTAKNPWVLKQIIKYSPSASPKILDMGCGAGFLSNDLITHYNEVFAVDLSAPALKIAQQQDKTQKVKYLKADATNLPFEDESFDIICAMDFLEHIEDLDLLLKEVARLLRPNGLFVYHTFNKNPLAYLIAIKFVEWLVPNTPKHMHVYHMFIRPQELMQKLVQHSLAIVNDSGIGPKIDHAFWKSIINRQVEDKFQFTLIPSKLIGYLGVARKLK